MQQTVVLQQLLINLWRLLKKSVYLKAGNYQFTDSEILLNFGEILENVKYNGD